ncbi:MAG: Gfo/Idh/MocA family oxidoreductase [Alphaproteobacteria bacterium]|nr:Gfo/Idh/MocA family oxidoreductase [Alphaproteobacteria bacterium]
MSRPTVLVGFGKIAAGLADNRAMNRVFRCAVHAQALQSHPGYDWCAVVDPDPAARRLATERWRIPVVVDRIEALPEPAFYRVAVLTSPPATRPAILAALPALEGIMAEKPLGIADGEAEAFAAMCDSRGLTVQVNFWRRGDAGIRALAGSKLSELVGPIQAAFGTYGNGLMNNGSHLVDLARMLLGEVREARSTGAWRPLPDAPIPGDGALPFTLTFETGATLAAAPIDFRNYREMSLDLWGERGRIELLNSGVSIFHHPLGPCRTLDGDLEVDPDRRQPLPSGAYEALYALYDDLVSALDQGRLLLSSARSASRTDQVIRAARKSAADGCPTALS